MAKISKKDANPIVALLLTLFVLGLGHFLINGQQRKWVFTLVATLIAYCLCCLPGPVVLVLSVIEAYKTAQRLQAGEEIDENEYSFGLMYKIVHIIDKTATFKGQA